MEAWEIFLRRKWRRALAVRERIFFSEEAVHLALAGGVGVIGAVSNLVFFSCWSR